MNALNHVKWPLNGSSTFLHFLIDKKANKSVISSLPMELLVLKYVHEKIYVCVCRRYAQNVFNKCYFIYTKNITARVTAK